jgi:Zn-dependent peptidase ImmA (M78 family)
MEPEDIEKFGLLKYVVPEKIDIAEYETAKLGIILQNGLILVNKSDSLEEQVKTVLHEIIHMHPEFISYTGGLWDGSISRNEEYERKIEQSAQQIYSKRKDIIDFITAKLREALPISEKFK